MNISKIIAVAALATLGVANAAPSADEIKQLGTTLTPWGAVKAGHKDGTIPEYAGGVPNAKPFDQECRREPLFAQGWRQYA